MAKRQKRLDPKQLTSQYQEYTGTPLTFVLRNRSVVLAEILSVDGNIFKVSNAMRHKIKIDLQDVQEVWLDEKA